MSGRIRALVALDSGVDRDVVQASLPHDGRIEISGQVRASASRPTTVTELVNPGSSG